MEEDDRRFGGAVVVILEGTSHLGEDVVVLPFPEFGCGRRCLGGFRRGFMIVDAWCRRGKVGSGGERDGRIPFPERREGNRRLGRIPCGKRKGVGDRSGDQCPDSYGRDEHVRFHVERGDNVLG